MVIQCCVPHCKTKGSSGLHNFPADRKRRLKWIQRLQIYHLDEQALPKSFHKVCQKHFRADIDYQTHANGLVSLKFSAVPSQFLPNSIWMEHNYISHNAAKSESQRAQTAVPIIQSTICHQSNSNDDSLQRHEQEIQDLKNKVSALEKTISDMHKTIRDISKQLRTKDKQLKLLHAKLKEYKINKKNVMHFLRQIFNNEQLAFFEMQMMNTGKLPKAREYTLKQKSFCLALYKHSPRTYRRLKTHFVLPSLRTMGRHSARLMFQAGINSDFFKNLKAATKKMADINKYCILVCDEMALKAHLDYSQKRDTIDGFVEITNIRRPTFATHALTFMIRGVNIPYKEPVSFFYTDGLKSFELIEMVKLVTEAVLDTGLRIIASVSDQDSINVSTIDGLMGSNGIAKANKGQLLSYKIRDVTIIHLFDVPHLLKCTRNNLLTKNLKHSVFTRWTSNSKPNRKKQDLIAMWEDVSDLYDLNMKGSKRLLPKITDEHIRPKKLKMKVCVATQVFSDTYGKLMLESSKKRKLGRDVSGTAQILLFFNNLFDSMNGSGTSIISELKSSVTKNSVHFEYWDYALDMLSKMSFIDKKTDEVTRRTKNIQHWESTIRGVKELTRKCFSYDITEVVLRNVNQDGLENFFGGIRMHCQVAKKPIPIHFRSAYVTTILNKLISTKSTKSNCEEDAGIALLINFQDFALSNKEKADENEDSSCDYDYSEEIVSDPLACEETLSLAEEDMSCVSSLIRNQVLKDKQCGNCRNALQTSSNFPSEAFTNNLKRLLSGINDLLPGICYKRSVKERLLFNLKDIRLDKIGCGKHLEEIEMKFRNCTAMYGISTFCKDVNDLLSGKVKTLFPQFVNIQIYENAFAFRNKGKHIGKFNDIFDKN